jgi:hypothetical protein
MSMVGLGFGWGVRVESQVWQRKLDTQTHDQQANTMHRTLRCASCEAVAQSMRCRTFVLASMFFLWVRNIYFSMVNVAAPRLDHHDIFITHRLHTHSLPSGCCCWSVSRYIQRLLLAFVQCHQATGLPLRRLPCRREPAPICSHGTIEPPLHLPLATQHPPWDGEAAHTHMGYWHGFGDLQYN